MQTVKVNAEALRHVLKGMYYAISKMVTLPILSHLKLDGAGGVLTIHGTDLDTYAIAEIECDGASAFDAVTVNYKQLKTLVNGKNGKENGFTFTQDSVTEGEITRTVVKLGYTVKGQPIEVPLQVLPADEYPPPMKSQGIEMDLTPDALQAISEVSAVMSTDQTRYILNGVCIACDTGSVVATDGRRLAIASGFECEEQLKGAKIIVSSNCRVFWWLIDQAGSSGMRMTYERMTSDMDEAEVKALKELDQAGKSSPRFYNMHFLCNTAHGLWNVTTKQIEGNYPNYKQVIPADNTPNQTIVRLGPAQQDFVKSAFAMLPDNSSGKTDPTVIVSIEDGKVYMRVKMVEQKDPISVRVEGAEVFGKDVMVSFNRRYLSDAASMRYGEWRFIDELSPGHFVDGDRQHVLMPMRMS